MITPLIFFSDAGHGWLRVSRDDVRNVRMFVSAFSRYSYQDQYWLYLEEDCDASKFLNAYRAVYGAMPVIHDVHTNGDSVIRRKARIQ